jgi:Flp pilus assembly protein TadG
MLKAEKHGYYLPTHTILHKNRASQKKQRGVAAVEFALVLPILLLLIFGTVELGVALYDKAVITNASREGARAGIVLKSPKPTATDIQTVVTNYTSTYLLTFGTQNSPVVTTTGAGNNFGQPLSVSVSYRYAGLGLGQMLSAITGPVTLSATTVMNNE